MKFYEIQTDEGPQLVYKLADIPKGQRKNPKVVEIPTDQKGLLAYINPLLLAKPQAYEKGFDAGAQRAITANPPVLDDEIVDAVYDPPSAFEQMMSMSNGENEPLPPREHVSGAGRVLSKIDGPPDMDKLVETIMKSRGHVLRRFAGAVALAFEGLK